MKLGIRRLVIVLISFFLQISLSLFIYLYLGEHMQFVKAIYTLIGGIIVLKIMKDSKNLSYHFPWVMIIIVFPLVGGLLYLIIGVNLRRNKTFKRMNKIQLREKKYLIQDELVTKEIKDKKLDKLNYISEYAGYPVYKNNDVKYYSLGDYAFPSILKDLKSAEKFIFMEYFIINKGEMWDSILKILEEKAAAGVEVRLMYDDMGCIKTLPEGYEKKLKEKGIKCVPFNPVKPFLGIFMNNRDHRKILVIDGKIGYTGGINIADEYINKIVRFGHWKDNSIRISGDAVWNFTVMFLTMWNSHVNEDKDYLKYKYEFKEKKENGYVVPYGDTPLDDEVVGENVYLNIINQAKDYVYIYTPYLIVDNEMLNALTLAAKRGVDIRIVVPGIPDKKVIYSLTQSYFASLAKYGVKIYKYNPGFIHSKVYVSDDTVATVGSINMDYRSLYLHFECGVYLENVKEIKDIKADLDDTMLKSKLLSKKDANPGFVKGMWQMILRMFAPLL